MVLISTESNKPLWLCCAFSLDDVEGIESLRWEDQQKIRKYVEEGVGSGSSSKSNVTAAEYGIEVSQTSRAICRHCSKKIMKGEVVFFFFLFHFLNTRGLFVYILICSLINAVL